MDTAIAERAYPESSHVFGEMHFGTCLSNNNAHPLKMMESLLSTTHLKPELDYF